ncbi:MAG: hypothetical protein GTO03_16945 [Planctomycetales bacterium]|nr:hypothetical protein [Planctomycetales bacterium]
MSVFCAVLGADADTPAGTKKYELKYKFAAGESIRSHIIHRAAVKTTIGGTSQTAETVSISVKRWDVKAVDQPGRFTIVHSVDYVDMKNDVTGRDTVRYDSRTDTNPPPGFDQIAGRIGIPLTKIVMDADGRMLAREEIAAGSTTSTQMTLPLPGKPIAIGESWTFPYEIDVPLQSGRSKKIKMRQLMELEKVVGGIATIQVATQVLTPVDSPEIEAQLVQRQSHGSIQFDIARGRMTAQQIDLDRRVTGYPNASSTMRYRTRFTEKLLDNEQAATRSPTPARR